MVDLWNMKYSKPWLWMFLVVLFHMSSTLFFVYLFISYQIFEETISYFIFVCNSKHRYITLGILYGYKVILQVVALILAVSIRKVKIKGLNDAAFIIAAIYVTSIVTSVIVVSTYTLSELVNMNAVVFSLCLFIGTTVILILVFIPPVSVLIES